MSNQLYVILTRSRSSEAMGWPNWSAATRGNAQEGAAWAKSITPDNWEAETRLIPIEDILALPYKRAQVTVEILDVPQESSNGE